MARACSGAADAACAQVLMGSGAVISVRGTLRIDGHPLQGVTVSAAAKTRGAWNHIVFEASAQPYNASSGAGCVIRNALLEFGGSADGIVRVLGTAPHLEVCWPCAAYASFCARGAASCRFHQRFPALFACCSRLRLFAFCLLRSAHTAHPIDRTRDCSPYHCRSQNVVLQESKYDGLSFSSSAATATGSFVKLLNNGRYGVYFESPRFPGCTEAGSCVLANFEASGNGGHGLYLNYASNWLGTVEFDTGSVLNNNDRGIYVNYGVCRAVLLGRC